jgi:hypothetical protein
MAFDVAEIKKRGWQQGSLFSIESTHKLLGAAYPGGGARLILATHDCDILHKGGHEPNIDAFVATPIERVSALDTKARNARRLHIPIYIDGAPRDHEIRFWSRTVLQRECLKSHAPAEDAFLGTNLPILREWLGKRYDRAAWPDAFNERLKRQGTDRKIRTILAPSEHCFRDIFLAVEPETDELAEDAAPYVVRVAMVITDANAGRTDIVEEAQRCAAALTDALRACPGIDVEAVETITDTDLTLADLDTYRLWDFTDLSFPD